MMKKEYRHYKGYKIELISESNWTLSNADDRISLMIFGAHPLNKLKVMIDDKLKVFEEKKYARDSIRKESWKHAKR